MKNCSILCVDDEANVLEALSFILNKAGYTVYTASTGIDALRILEDETIDPAIIDYKMPEMTGMELLQKIKESHPDVEVLVLTAHGSIENAVEFIKLGAFDYVLKPFVKDDIVNRIEKVLRMKNLRDENVQIKRSLKDKCRIENLIGATPLMTKIFEMIPKIADSDSTILILGETGTGKEELAKAIHYTGIRADKMFNVVDCASMNPNLFESELFGHVKGAYTGAISDKTRLPTATAGGTLFLDEIAEIPVTIQVKLLRAIEEREVRPIGSIQAKKFDARIIAATSRNLQELVERHEFREDLFYRLNVITIEIPPLRERKDDIPLMVNHFIKKLNAGSNRIKGITGTALEAMMAYDWHGNVRELYNCIERAFTLGTGEYIDVNDLPQSLISKTRDMEF